MAAARLILLLLLAQSLPAQIAFREHHIVLNEGIDSARVHVVRNEGIGKRADVRWFTLDGTARPEADFWPAKDTATFSPGDTMVTISVGVIDNMLVDSAHVFHIVLVLPHGADTADVEIRDNDVASSPFVSVEPRSIDFGAVNVGVLSRRAVTVRNAGTGDLRFGPAVVTPGPEAGFQVAYQPTILMVAPGGWEQIQLGFTPPRGSAGTERRGMITLRTNLGMSPVSVTGFAIDSLPPTIVFEGIRERDTFITGTTVKLPVQISDNDTLVDATIEYISENSRGTVSHIFTDVTSLTWSIPDGLVADRVRLRVLARDRMGNIAQGQSVAFAVRPKR